MWYSGECHDFSIVQNLCQINFGDCRSTKLASIPHLKALNFDFKGLLHFSKAEINQINKIQSSRNGKIAILQLPDSPKMISREI